jgi:TIR domain-containing protein
VTERPDLESGARGHIFVSYSRHDLEWVQQLVTDLEAVGLPVWLDVHKLKPGVVWDSEIELALRGTDVLLVVLSDKSAASTNVLDEINFALSKNRLVVPVLHRACDIPYRLARLQHIDFTGPREVALNRLIERLQAATSPGGLAPLVAPPAATPPPPVPAERRTGAPTPTPTQAASTLSAAVPLWRRPAIVGAAVGLCALLAAGFWWLQGRNDSRVPPTSSPTAALQAPAQVDAAPSVSPSVAPPAASQPPNGGAESVASERAASTSRKVEARGASPAPRISASRPPEKPGDSVVKPLPSPTRSAELLRGAPIRETPPSPTPAAAAPTSLPATPPPPSAASVRPIEPSAPPARPTPAARDEEAQIRTVIALYQRALNEKNLSLVEQTRPRLSRSEAQALLKGMEGPHTVSFADIVIKVSDRQATARLTRHDILPNAPHLQTSVTITLLKVGDSWVIERIERTQ